MKKVNIYRINAFTTQPFAGNPAVVVYNDSLSEDEMRLIASEMNVSETAFLTKSDAADYKLRWLTPTSEVELCGHATIASLHFLKETGALQENSAVRFETLSGILKCCDEKGFYYMQIPDYNIEKFKTPVDDLLVTLGLKGTDIEGENLLLGNGYLYLRIKDLDTLGKIKPDFEKLKSLSTNIKIKSMACYSLQTFETESTAHLRFFDPVEGINEDPVTGSANGPLVRVLIHTGVIKDSDIELQFEQGDFIGRPGRVKVIYRNNKIFIAGKAFTFLKGEIYI